MANNRIQLKVEPQDPLGVYRIEATLHDKNSNKEIFRKYEIEIE